MATFTAGQIPNLTNHTVVVTGGNSGIGRATASALVSQGARVVLAVRDPAKGAVAAQALAAETPTAGALTGEVAVRQLDLADLASIRAFADGFTAS